ncbi:hypothetical protein CHS0354_005372, partial [Potamilus streckersoni]
MQELRSLHPLEPQGIALGGGGNGVQLQTHVFFLLPDFVNSLLVYQPESKNSPEQQPNLIFFLSKNLLVTGNSSPPSLHPITKTPIND